MKPSELGKRVLTGVVGGAVVVLLIVFGEDWGTRLITGVISFGMVWEFADMAFSLPDRFQKRLVLSVVPCALVFLDWIFPEHRFFFAVSSVLAALTYFLFAAARLRSEDLDTHVRELSAAVFGTLYLAFLPLYLSTIREVEGGEHWTILFLLIIWSGDTGAYFGGKRFGSRKLYPLISPKKTVEGSISGLAASVAVASGYRALWLPDAPWAAIAVMAVGVNVAGAVGDLCESLVKRAFGRKDSGSILPGHGGFLDRFDSVVFAVPIMYGFMRLFRLV